MSDQETIGKLPLTGLVDMGDISFYNVPGGTPAPIDLNDIATLDPSTFGGMVVNVTWAELQSTENGTIAGGNPIDQALAAVGSYNCEHGTNIGIKLRVYGGYAAPDWAKNIDGPPIAVPGKENGDTVYPSETVGRFWTSDYIAAWTTFETELAAKYDGNSLIREVAITSGAMATDEPFVQPQTDQFLQLAAAGYSDIAEERVLLSAATQYSGWTETPLDYTFNLFHEHDGTQPEGDPTFTLTAMQQAANSPHETYLANHALDEAGGEGSDSFVYAQIDADLELDPAPEADFQTVSPKKLGPVDHWTATVLHGVTYEPSSIELWPGSPGDLQQGGFTTLQTTDVENLATILADGLVPPNAGGRLGLIAPALATGVGDAVAFTGYQSVLLATDAVTALLTVTVTSGIGAALYAKDAYDAVAGMGSPTLTITGSLAAVDTALAGLAETLPDGATGDTLAINVNGGTIGTLARALAVTLQAQAATQPSVAGAAASGVPSFDPGSTVTIDGDFAIGGSGGPGVVLVGGANTDVTIAGNLTIGAAGGAGGVLLAALASVAQDTAHLTVSGTLAVQENGALDLTGTLDAGAVQIAPGGVVNANGALVADGTLEGQQTIVNDGSIAVAADTTLGVTALTLGALAGTGALGIGAGATLVLTGAVGQGQTVTFAPNSQAQLSTAPTPLSELELEAPALMQGTIAGFSFGDDLIVQNFAAIGQPSYANGTLTVSGTLAGGISATLGLALSGDLVGETPESILLGNATSIRFVPNTINGQLPTVQAPATLHGVSETAVPVLDIAVLAPVPTVQPANVDVSVTVSAGSGTLEAGGERGRSITLSGTLGLTIAQNVAAVEQRLAALNYTASGAGSDTITITATDYAGSSAPEVIAVASTDAPGEYSWATPTSGGFGNAASWMPEAGAPAVQPGGGDSVTLGAGIYTVTGNGAAGELDVDGTVTLTGTVQAVGSGPVAAKIDQGGDLVLATGAFLQSGTNLVLGQTAEGTLTLIDGSAAIGSASNQANMVLGATTGSSGVAIVESALVVSRDLTIGDAGTGALQVDDVASVVIDQNAILGETGSGSAVVDAGYWDSTGTLTVGEQGIGTLAIGGEANGRTGQVTDADGIIAADTGSTGQVSVAQGAWLTTGLLAVGPGGSGTLVIGAGGSVSVSVNPNTSADLATSSGTIEIGGGGGSAGTIAIDGGGTLTGAASMFVGAGAGIGLLQIGLAPGDGGFVAVSGSLTIGTNGSVQLDGDLGIAGEYGANLNAASLVLQGGAALAGTGAVGGLANGSGAYALVPIANGGSITASGGTLLLYADISGTGDLAAGSGGTLELEGSVASGQTASFDAPAGTLVLDNPQDFAGGIEDFAPGDVIALPGLAYSDASWTDDTLTLTGAATPLALSFLGDIPRNILLGPDGQGGSLIEAALPCFASGTRIRTPTGETVIDDLCAGDLVVTRNGTARPIRWIDHRHIRCGTFANPTTVMPIRVRAHAFAPAIPARDLLLSPDHAIFAEGVLIPVKCLQNGTSIARAPLAEITYFHLELDTHDIILAEGLAVESYLDTGSRTIFANRATTSLRPEFGVSDETAYLLWETGSCAPLRVTGLELHGIRRHLARQLGLRMRAA